MEHKVIAAAPGRKQEKKELTTEEKAQRVEDAAKHELRQKDYRRLREKAYEDHEGLPNDVWGNIDELWKALEAAELNGTELPPSASSIIRIRRRIKTDIPKGS